MNKLYKLIYLSLFFRFFNSAAQTQHYIGSSGSQDMVMATTSLTGGNRVMVGTQFNGSNYDAIITCISPGNAVMWSKSVATPANDRFTAVCSTSDGGCVAVGYVNQSVSTPYLDNQASVYKFDATGSLVWRKVFKATSNGEIFFSVFEVPGSGNIVCAGNYAYGSINVSGLVVNLSSSGVTNWAKTFSTGFYTEIHAIKYLSGKIIGAGFYRVGVGAKWITNVFALNETNGSQVWHKSYNYASNLNPVNDGQFTDRMQINDSNIFVDVYLAGAFGVSGAYPSILSIDTLGNNPFALEYPLSGYKYANAISTHISGNKEFFLIQNPSSTLWDKLMSSSAVSGITDMVCTRIKDIRNASATRVFTRSIATTGTQAVVEGAILGSKFIGVGSAKNDPAKSIGTQDIFKIEIDTGMAATTTTCIQDVSGQLFSNPSITYNSSFSFSAITDVAFSIPTDATVSPVSYATNRTCAINNMTPDFTYSRTACLTDSFTDITTTLIKGIQSWYWTFGDGGTAVVKTPVHTYSAFGSYTVKLVVTDSLGNKDSVSKVVKIDSYHFLKAGNDTSVCRAALPVMLRLSASGGKSYNWTPSSGLSSSAVANPTAIVWGAATYIVTGTDSLGCTDKDSTTISIVSATVTIDPDSGKACAGSVFQLNARGANRYKWTPASGLSSDTSRSPVAVISDTVTYVVTGTDLNGCTAKDTITITSIPAPLVTTDTDSIEVCEHAMAIIDATGAARYKWYPTDGIVVDTLTSISVKVDTAYYLKVKGWDSTGCYASDSVFLYTRPAPDVKIHAEERTVGCGKETYVDASGAAVYTWSPSVYFSDPNGSSTKVSISEASWIYVAGTNPNGCSDVDSMYMEFNDQSLVLVPSAFTPNGDGRNDEIKPIIICDFIYIEFAVYNRWGQEVFYNRSSNAPWNGRFNGQPCDPGTYFYFVKGKDFSGKQIIIKGDITLIR